MYNIIVNIVHKIACNIEQYDDITFVDTDARAGVSAIGA